MDDQFQVTSAPSDEQADDALRKGLGRSYRWALSGQLSESRLLDACLTDLRFDVQVEGPRGDWLWALICAANCQSKLCDSVFNALRAVDDSKVGPQLCQLARHFAFAGDQRFRILLRDIVVRKPTSDELIGEEDLIRLEGSAGFELALTARATSLSRREYDWHDSVFIDNAREILGDEAIDGLLRLAAARELRVQAFKDASFAYAQRSAQRLSEPRSELLRNSSAADVISAVSDTQTARFRFRGWGRQASDEDLQTIMLAMFDCDDADALSRYLQIFGARAIPQFDQRLLNLCLHDNKDVRRRAVIAVSNNEHPEIRRIALKKLPLGELQDEAITLLCNNFQPGDEQRIVDALRLPDDACLRHWTLMSALKLLEKNPAAECRTLGAVVYHETPCSSCRHAVVKLMQERRSLVDDIRDECQFDVELDTRQLVGGPAWE